MINLLCLQGVALALVYKVGEEGRPAGPYGRAKCGVLLGLQVLVGVHQREGGKKEGEGGEKGKAGRPPSPTRFGGGRVLPLGLGRPPWGSLSPKARPPPSHLYIRRF